MRNKNMIKIYIKELKKHWKECAWWDENPEYIKYADDLLDGAEFLTDDYGNIVIMYINFDGLPDDDFWACHNIAAKFTKYGKLLWLQPIDDEKYDI